ncbi:MAG: methionine gamma-lyase family protein, partial [Clostridia bacterium]
MQNNDLARIAAQVDDGCRDAFARIERVAQVNSEKVLGAFRKNRVADAMFAGTTGYGYDDIGRDTLDKIYADVFDAEDALVRIQFVNGTHTIACALFGVLRPGDTLTSLTGAPYDTLQSTIGIAGNYPGSLADFGVHYREVAMTDGGMPDLPAIRASLLETAPAAVLIQRSRGYSTRAALSISDIEEICRVVRAATPDTCIIVDNCYGEFVEECEPTYVGADLIVGSLIKNPGGGIAPTGGYIAGRADYVERAAMRLTAPGIGRECGSTLGNNRLLYQGFFVAPHTTAQALKTAVFSAGLFEKL